MHPSVTRTRWVRVFIAAQTALQSAKRGTANTKMATTIRSPTRNHTTDMTLARPGSSGVSGAFASDIPATIAYGDPRGAPPASLDVAGLREAVSAST